METDSARPTHERRQERQDKRTNGPLRSFFCGRSRASRGVPCEERRQRPDCASEAGQKAPAAEGAEGVACSQHLPTGTSQPSPRTFGRVRHDEHRAVAGARTELHDAIDGVERQPSGLGPVSRRNERKRKATQRQRSNRESGQRENACNVGRGRRLDGTSLLTKRGPPQVRDARQVLEHLARARLGLGHLTVAENICG